MALLTFDTLKFLKKLRKSGFNEDQAEALSKALKEAQQASIEDLATKSDSRELELRLTIKLGTMMAGSIAIVAALVKLL
ncbi:CCDC90 family protein [Desulforhabdus sp. TSK]|uniref:CCDC90 family protein n=1 Tax=Desulforhabdus sp. TSK TaxID=2925014 RepID=UPI001FC7E653|nr:CCDC90 family protein [Desulforhabdus sp. TSK]GKT09962.1 hypothetical protein DSTSK_32670 [Desulforhabdus sp. TSK]